MGDVEEATAPELVKMQVRVNTKVDSKENTEVVSHHHCLLNIYQPHCMSLRY